MKCRVMMFVALFVMAAIASVGAAPPTRRPPQDKVIIRITLNRQETVQFQMMRLPAYLDIAGLNVKRHTVDVVGHYATLQKLRESGFDAQVVPDLSIRELSEEYQTNEKLAAYLEQKQAQYPEILKLLKIGQSHEGRPLIAVKISSNVNSDEIKPTVAFNGLHHAREVMTIEIARDIIDTLTAGYGSDERITRWVKQTEIWVIPVVNPDGLHRVWAEDSWWRKNAYAQDNTVYGVDLNRNYPYKWGSCDGSSGYASSQTYRGPAAGSEPETSAMTAFFKEINPVFDISYHSYSELVLYPYGCENQYTAENETMKKLADHIAAILVNDDENGGYASGTPWDILYSTDGDDVSWQYAQLGIFPFVIEVNNFSQGFQPNYKQWRDKTVQKQRAGWQFLLDELSRHLLAGSVVDATTRAPLAAKIVVRNIPYAQDEIPRQTSPKTGEFFKLLLPGRYEVAFMSEGYETTFLTIDQGDELQYHYIEMRKQAAKP